MMWLDDFSMDDQWNSSTFSDPNASGDTMPPTIGLTSLQVVAAADDPLVTQMTIGGQNVSVSGVTFTQDVPLGPSPDSILLNATDDAGNMAQRIVQVTY